MKERITLRNTLRRNKMKEINIEELKEESKKLNLQIKELEKKYITPIKNKKKNIDAIIENTIQCPKCKKYFKYVYLEKVVIHYNYSKSGYFGDETTEYFNKCNVLECPSCGWHWEKRIHSGFHNASVDIEKCTPHDEIYMSYIPRKVKIDSNNKVIYPKKK